MASSLSSSNILPLSTSYSTATCILVPVCIVYLGLYVSLRNHYIFKPRIQYYLKKTKIKSIIAEQLIIDLLSSISIITFLITSILLTNNDDGIALIIQHDLYWIGLGMGIIVYRNFKHQQKVQMKIILKNALFLISAYITIAYQYFSSYSMLMMGLLLMSLYCINLILKANQETFIQFMQQLFFNKPPQILIKPYYHSNMVQSPQYLSNNFPILKSQIQQRMKPYESKLKKLKLKTKALVTKKLLLLSIAVRISQDKLANKQAHQVCNYYGGLNGTASEKVKRLQMEVKPIIEDNKENSDIEQPNANSLNDSDDQLEVLFTIFPIKLFQSSRIVSLLFTLFINLAFGISLDYSMNITNTLQYGNFFYILYALLLLPILPKISKYQYFDSMCLSSLWRYFLIGLLVVIYQVTASDPTAFIISDIIKYSTIGLILLMIFIIIFLLSQSKGQFKIPIAFILLFCANIALQYQNTTN